MVSISLVKRKYKLADGTKAETEDWYAQIRFTQPRASYLRSTGTPDKRKAGVEARRLARDIEENELSEWGRPIFTLGGMFSQWIEEKGQHLRSGKDLVWQIKIIVDVLGEATPIQDITNKVVHGFVQGAKALGKSDVVINRCLTRLRATMNYAAKKWEAPVSNKIDWMPHFTKEPQAREIYLSPEDARIFMERLPEHIALAFAFSIYTGMRLNELKTLTLDRIDLDRGTASVDAKGGGRRTVWLSRKAVAVLHVIINHWEKGAGHNGHLTVAGPIFNLENRRRHWEKVRREMGRPELHWHDLRAMTATWARQYAGKDVRLISQAMGHSDTKVTERYTRVVDREIATMLDMLPDLGMPMQTSGRVVQTLLANTEDRG